MTRIESCFSYLRSRGEKALIPYISVGDLSIEDTKELVLKMEESGADIIELGVPFSDPTADGPIIQRASQRSLKRGTNLMHILQLVRSIRKVSEIPLILMGYYNPFFVFGTKSLAEEAKSAGVDGILVVDLPPEEAQEFKPFLDKEGINMIFLLSPVSPPSRIKLVSDLASGFIYFVSVTGVTGTRNELPQNIPESLREIRKFTELPIGVGFGISNPTQAKAVANFADAVIIGSAMVEICEKNLNNPLLAIERIGQFIINLKKGIKGETSS